MNKKTKKEMTQLRKDPKNMVKTVCPNCGDECIKIELLAGYVGKSGKSGCCLCATMKW